MNKDYMNEKWFEILIDEIEATSQRKVAEKLGYSITTINLVVNGKYAGKTDAVGRRVIEVFTRVNCPFLGSEIARSVCVELAKAPAPTHNPIKMQQWKACKKCPKRPD